MPFSLGISAFSHDSAAALIHDGKIVALVEQERLNREKYTTAFPREAILSCLEIAGIDMRAVESVSFFNRADLEIIGGLRHAIAYFPKSLHLFGSKFGGNNADDAQSFLKRIHSFLLFPSNFKKMMANSDHLKFYSVEHHMAHAASCFYPSPFESAAVLTWDGRGEFSTCLGAHAVEGKISKVFQNNIPHSLGIFYTAITEYLGFRPFSDEWKVMGLSAYGSERFVKQFESVLTTGKDGLFQLNLDYFAFQFYGRSKFLSDFFYSEFGAARRPGEALDQRHFDIAFAAQRALERVGLSLANYLQERSGEKNLCMTGGVAQNILLNSYIMEHSKFTNFYIQPVATDAGAGLGAALYTHFQKDPRAVRHQMKDVYLGPSFTDEEIIAALNKMNLEYEKPQDICVEVAKSLARDKIVGWFQGRMEAGPRALGNRSLLASPTKVEQRERLNTMIKKRENFRPFAPAILEEFAQEYFLGLSPAANTFMLASAQVRPDRSQEIPAVVHVDGSARPQLVSSNSNPLFYRLLEEFNRLTGVPVLLNTSFNDQEPIVCSPSDAIATFLKTSIDELAIGSFLIRKK